MDDHDRQNWVEMWIEDWNDQMDQLVDAYLHYVAHTDGEGGSQPPPPEDQSSAFEMEVVDVFCEYSYSYPSIYEGS